VPVLFELERGSHQVADRPAVRPDLSPGVGLVRRTIEFLELGLGIERIDLAGAAIHEEKDRPFRSRREMRLLRGQEITCVSTRRWRAVRASRAGKEPVARQEIDQGQPGKPAADLPQKLAPGVTTGGQIGNESRADGWHSIVSTIPRKGLIPSPSYRQQAPGIKRASRVKAVSVSTQRKMTADGILPPPLVGEGRGGGRASPGLPPPS